MDPATQRLIDICKAQADPWDGCVSRMCDEISSCGFDIMPDVPHDLVNYEMVWEHEMVKEHNSKAHILNQGFMGLYRHSDGGGYVHGVGGEFRAPPWLLCHGRIGNSTSICIERMTK